MQISIAYQEIQRFILREYKREIGMRYVDSHTLSLFFSPYRLVPAVRIDITVQDIIGNTIILSYNGRRGINPIIRGILTFMDDKINNGIISVLPDKRLIYIQLESIKGAKKTWEYLELKDIRFVEKGIIAGLKLKE